MSSSGVSAIDDRCGYERAPGIGQPRWHAHDFVASFVSTNDESLAVSPFVVAELDYVIVTRIGVPAALATIRELASGAYDLASLTADDLRTCAEIIARFDDRAIDVTDASLVVLAKRCARSRS